MILQSESSECSLASLAMVANAHGLHVDLADLRRRFPVSLKGASLSQLIAHAGSLNFSSRPLRLELEELAQLQMPCILHWDLNHFVVLKKVGRRSITILDPTVGERRLPFAEVSRHFTGVALELTPNADFQPADQRQRVALSALTGKVLGLKRSLLQVFALAVVLELFAITSPLLNQLVVDDAIATHDADLLTVMVVGFALLLVIQTAVGLARSWMVMVLGMSLSLQWASNVFAHMVKLPVEYFEKRHLGDVVSRFGSVGTIQKTLLFHHARIGASSYALTSRAAGQLASVLKLVDQGLIARLVLHCSQGFGGDSGLSLQGAARCQWLRDQGPQIAQQLCVVEPRRALKWLTPVARMWAECQTRGSLAPYTRHLVERFEEDSTMDLREAWALGLLDRVKGAALLQAHVTPLPVSAPCISRPRLAA